MTFERFQELLSAGPGLTNEDFERLKTFVPRKTVIANSVEYVFRFWRYWMTKEKGT